jgi:hypothetical protein
LNPWTCQSLHSLVQQLFQASLHPLHKKERFIALIGLLWWRSIRSNPLDWDRIRATIKVNSKMLEPHHNYQQPSWPKPCMPHAAIFHYFIFGKTFSCPLPSQ